MVTRPKFSVIIPAYDEELNIGKTVSEIYNVFKKFGHGFEIIIVNDGSTDKTAEQLGLLVDQICEVSAVNLDRNYGKGYAIRMGAVRSKGEYIVFMDADLDIHPKQIGQVVDMLDKNLFNVAIGSKRHPESELDYPVSRRIISTIYYWIVRIMFGLNVSDTQAGIKIYKREVIMSILPRIIVKKYAFDLEMLVAAHKLGYRIVEFPIRLTFSRKFGRITLGDCWKTGVDTLAIFYRHRILDFYNHAFPINPNSPKISIIIPVGKPDKNILQCTNACLNQDYRNFEIIILPDESPSLQFLRMVNNDKVKIIPTGPVNPSTKRNIGSSRASGEILAFLDDDAFPQRDWLTIAVRHFADDTIAAVGGPGVTPAGSSLKERVSGNIYASPIVSGTYRYRYTPHRYLEVDDFPSCNLLVLRTVFATVGGFSAQYWPGEDTLLCREIVLRTQKRIVYDPHLIVEHRRRPFLLKHLAQVSRYALHRGYFIKYWPENSLKISYFMPSILIVFIIIGSLLLTLPGYSMFYVFTISLYICVCLFFSIQLSSIRETLLTFIGTISTHFTYGLFFLIGLSKTELKAHKPATTAVTFTSIESGSSMHEEMDFYEKIKSNLA